MMTSLFKIILCSLLLSLTGCLGVDSEHAGGGVQTTNGGITYANGTPGADVLLRIVPRGYLMDSTGDYEGVLSLRTDQRGEYSLKMLPPGEYNLEAVDEIGNSVLYSFNVNEGEVHIPPTLVLLPSAYFSGELSYLDPEVKAYIQVRGLARVTLVENNRFDIEVPQGEAYQLGFLFSDSSLQYVSNESYTLTSGKVFELQINPYAQENYENWSFSTSLSIDLSSVNLEQDLYSFPMLIRLENSRFNFSEFQPEGKDLRFSKMDGSPLTYTIENWEPNMGAAVWVLMDTLFSNSTSQSIKMYWGNEQAAGYSNSAGVFDTTNGYKGVFSMEQDPIGSIQDLTHNKHHGNSEGNMTSDNLIVGVIGNSINFDGVDDKISLTGYNIRHSITLSAWAKFRSTDTYYQHIVGNYSGWFLSGEATGNPIMRFSITTDTETWATFDSSANLDTVWHHYTGVYDGTAIHSYLDGVWVESQPKSGEILVDSNKIIIGGHYDANVVHYWNGSIDHVSISTDVRSPDWIKLSFENQKPSSTLISFQ